MILTQIAFWLTVIVALLIMLFGFRLAEECTDIDTDLRQYVMAMELLGISVTMLLVAFYHCPYLIFLG